MAVRSFNWNDLPPLLDFYASIKPVGGQGRQLRLKTFEEVLRQPWLKVEENCFLFEEGGHIQAYGLVVPELAIGRTVLELEAGTGPEGREAEQVLLARALERAGELNARVLHHCVGKGSHRETLLESRGFSQVRVYWDMLWPGGTLPTAQPRRGFSVRAFNSGDAPALTEIQNAAFDGSWGFCPNTVEQIEYRSSMSNTSHEGIRILYHGDDVAGYCWTCLTPQDSKTRGIIGMIGVAPAYRGQGVSKPVLLSGMEYLRSVGVDDIGLQVDGNNTPAIRLYQSVGFQKAAELHWYEFKLHGT